MHEITSATESVPPHQLSKGVLCAVILDLLRGLFGHKSAPSSELFDEKWKMVGI